MRQVDRTERDISPEIAYTSCVVFITFLNLIVGELIIQRKTSECETAVDPLGGIDLII